MAEAYFVGISGQRNVLKVLVKYNQMNNMYREKFSVLAIYSTIQSSNQIYCPTIFLQFNSFIYFNLYVPFICTFFRLLVGDNSSIWSIDFQRI